MQQCVACLSIFSYFSDFFSVTLKRVMPVRQLSNRYARAKSVATGCHGCLAHLVTVNTIHIHPLTAAKLLENLGCKRTVLDRPLWIGHALWLSRQAGALKSVCTCQSQKSDKKNILLRNPTARNLQEYDNKKTVLLLWFHGPLTTAPYHRNCHTDPAIRLQDSTSSRSRAQQDLHEPHDIKIE